MPRYLDTRGHSKLAIAVCARCGVKYPWDELDEDGNSPGLRVCRDGCRDVLDPWRLAPRETEDITLQWSRPDLSLAPGAQFIQQPLQLQAVLSPDGAIGIASGPGKNDIAIAPPVTVVSQPQPWSANTSYPLGYQVTPGIAYGPTTDTQQIFVYLAIVPGLSGATPPVWPQAFGVMVSDFQVTWINAGLFLP